MKTKKLFVISGSSGVGKGTVIKAFLKKDKKILNEWINIKSPKIKI